MSMRGPYSPRSIRVEVDPRRRPLAVAGRAVEQVREEWVVEDGWWTEEPLRRHYFELVLSDGRNVVVFRDESRPSGDRRWYLQRA